MNTFENLGECVLTNLGSPLTCAWFVFWLMQNFQAVVMEMATGTNGGLLFWVALTNQQVIKTALQPGNYIFTSLMGKIKFLAQAFR